MESSPPTGYWVRESIKDKPFEEFYEIVREIGRGATSVVHECQHRGTGQRWAVKVITKKVDQKIIRSEIGILLKISHPHVIRLKEIYETPNLIQLVLELVTGGELFDRVTARGSYSERDSAASVRQILEAVKYLHENGIVHRDLKPENLLYADPSDNSALKIADFGLGKLLTSEAQMHTVCGTPGYCAPEVLRGVSYGPEIDMWSVGVIAYILLGGYEPFYAENETEMYRRILLGQYNFDSPW